MPTGIYKLHIDMRRSSDLEGVFIAESEDVQALIESQIEIYFGEVAGKHSEIYGAIEAHEIILVSEEDAAIRVIRELDLESGFNPFCYSTTGDVAEMVAERTNTDTEDVLGIVRAWAELKEKGEI